MKQILVQAMKEAKNNFKEYKEKNPSYCYTNKEIKKELYKAYTMQELNYILINDNIPNDAAICCDNNTLCLIWDKVVKMSKIELIKKERRIFTTIINKSVQKKLTKAGYSMCYDSAAIVKFKKDYGTDEILDLYKKDINLVVKYYKMFFKKEIK